MAKELKDMGWQELQDLGAWEIIHGMARGEPAKGIAWRIIDLALMWKRATDDKPKKK